MLLLIRLGSDLAIFKTVKISKNTKIVSNDVNVAVGWGEKIAREIYILPHNCVVMMGRHMAPDCCAHRGRCGKASRVVGWLTNVRLQLHNCDIETCRREGDSFPHDYGDFG